jgi:thiamine-phosphate pyrophosphorylase
VGEFTIPRLYPIIDVACFAPDQVNNLTSSLSAFARSLLASGVTLLQYRNKSGNTRELLGHARELRRVAGSSVRLIMNDRADVCLAADFDGVHLGQDDLSPAGARRLVGDVRCVGISTHNPEQVSEAEAWPVDYVAVGPVFPTSSKSNPDPVIGLEGVRRARALTKKPLVAIGGITRLNCRHVIEAGADSVAVISDLVADPSRSAKEFLRILT